jgi:hypothetical protein
LPLAKILNARHGFLICLTALKHQRRIARDPSCLPAVMIRLTLAGGFGDFDRAKRMGKTGAKRVSLRALSPRADHPIGQPDGRGRDRKP